MPAPKAKIAAADRRKGDRVAATRKGPGAI